MYASMQNFMYAICMYVSHNVCVYIVVYVLEL